MNRSATVTAEDWQLITTTGFGDRPTERGTLRSLMSSAEAVEGLDGGEWLVELAATPEQLEAVAAHLDGLDTVPARSLAETLRNV